MRNQDRAWDREQKEQNRYKKFRKVSIPSGTRDYNMGAYYHAFKQYTKKRFRDTHTNDTFYKVNPIIIGWDCGKGAFVRMLPAIVIHAILLAAAHATHQSLASSDTVRIIGLLYLICFFFAYRRVSDHKAYYNSLAMVSKYSINRKLANTIRYMSDTNDFKPQLRLDHLRMKFNKINLFPSLKEIAFEYQLHERAMKSRDASDRSFAETKYERCSLNEKREEHYAAKEIADWKANHFGGPNEYDVMVRKYSHRTTPAIRQIIKEVQHNDF